MNTAVRSAPVNTQWTSVCKEEDLLSDAGICVLFNNEQVALFKDGKTGRAFAVSNFDPISNANVLSRGILGSINQSLVVASPLYKQHFCLETGECLESDCRVKSFPIRVNNGEVQLATPSEFCV